MIVRPRRVGSFLTSRPSSDWLNLSALSRIATALSRDRSTAESRCFMLVCSSRKRSSAFGPSVRCDPDAVDLIVFDEAHLDVLTARRRHVLTHIIGAQRQLAVAAVHEDSELHGAGPADIAQRVQGRAD